MCIRDRAETEALKGQLQSRDSLIGEMALSFDDIEKNLALICLLYTSDAADERSSVDLGGRRIIKKKTRIKHRGGKTLNM